jgi:hypothetical protein
MTTGDPDGFEVRGARPGDYEAVVAFTEDTWPERGGDYVRLRGLDGDRG